MLRRFGWLALLLALACRNHPDTHSVLLVTIDTLRADAVGAYGGTRGASPHLDRLAERGVLFEQAHASAPSTLPSHVSILTGLQPYHHRVRDNGIGKLADPQVTLAERLHEAGYVTAGEVATLVLAHSTGLDQGFERYRDTETAGVQLRQLRVGADGSMDDPSAVGSRPDAKTVDLHSRPASDITRSGIAFLREHREHPFFLWLHYYDPHWPYAPPAPFAAKFAHDRYAGGVAYADDSVGQVLEELARLGLDDRTLVVVTGDHGEGLGDHGESRHSYLVYQETMHVPLLIAGPGVPRGRRVATPIETVDIAPTIAAWAGLPAIPSDGRSLLPAFTGALPDQLVYGESVSLGLLVDVSPLRFLREGRWKLIHKPIPELYDLSADPAETKNLAGAEAARVTDLRDRLAALLTGASASAPAAAHKDLDATARAQLESLGYLVGGSTPTDDTKFDSMEVHGPDPTQVMPKLDPYIDALGASQFSDARQTADLLGELAREFPNSSPILELLLDAQLAAGRAEGAVTSMRRGIEIDPEHQRYWSGLGELLGKLGRDAEAADILEKTLHRWPCDLTSLTNLASVHARTGAREQQIAVLEQGVEQCKAPPELVNDLAYQLATTTVTKRRDGKRALALAESMIGSLRENPLALDTLAVAQAEAGQRADARATLARAIDLAVRKRLPEDAVRLLRGHAEQIAAGTPIRE